MNHQAIIQFFLQIGVMLAVALICGHLMRKIQQPAVLGELIGGIFLGPTVFGLLAPEQSARLFPAEGPVALSLEAVLKIGMLFFLFVAGLEVKLGDLHQKRFCVTTTSLLGLGLPFALGFGMVLLWPDLWETRPANLPLALFIGAALSISALPVIARILMDLKLMQSDLGVIIMAAATINDLVGWTLFAVILSSLIESNEPRPVWLILTLVSGYTAFILGMGRWVGQPLLRRLRTTLIWPGGFIGLITVFLFIAAALAESIGLHAIFGAFLIGVALGQDEDADHEVHDIIYQFAISFFAPLYFVSIGLKANFATHFDGWLILAVLLIACLGKIAGAGLGARWGGAPPHQALAIGFGMNARGAMEIILASVALEYGLINQKIFVALVVMALFTSMLSGPIMQWLMNKKPHLTSRGKLAEGLDL